MERELTFGEVKKLLDDIRTEHPTAEQMEIVAYAYMRGYSDALKESEE